MPAKHILVMLDSCFSGTAGRSVLAKGARPMTLSLENPLLAAGKVIVLAAATGNQISSDYDKAGHGLFTYALLTGLQGAADQDKDGLVTLRELYPYVRKQVTETAIEELNREQTPILLPSVEALDQRAGMTLAKFIPSADNIITDPARSLTERDKAGLRGDVQTVIEEAALFNHDNSGHWQETAKHLKSITTYDRRGHRTKTEEFVFRHDNKGGFLEASLDYREVNLYGGHGNKTERVVYNAEDKVLGKNSLTYDASGNLTEESHFNDEGSLVAKFLYARSSNGKTITTTIYRAGRENNFKLGHHGTMIVTLDDHGNKMRESYNGILKYDEEHFYDAAGNKTKSRTNCIVRIVRVRVPGLKEELEFPTEVSREEILMAVKRLLRDRGIDPGPAEITPEVLRTPSGLCKTEVFDSKGRVIEIEERDSNLNLIDKTTSVYDRFGNVTKESRYDTEGIFGGSFEFSYEFDSQGNWIKRSRSSQFFNPMLQPVIDVPEVLYRRIIYFPDRGGDQSR